MVKTYNDVSNNILEKILFDATSSPSADNNQPWHIDIKSNGFDIYYAKNRGLSSDSTHMLDYILVCYLKILK